MPNRSGCRAGCRPEETRRLEPRYPLHRERSLAGRCCGRADGRHADRRRCWRSATSNIVPRAAADAITRIDTRLVATLFLAEIRVPSARCSLPAQRLGFALANLVSASEPVKVARAGRVLGNEEARELGLQLCLLLLGLRQHCRRSQKSDGNG